MPVHTKKEECLDESWLVLRAGLKADYVLDKERSEAFQLDERSY